MEETVTLREWVQIAIEADDPQDRLETDEWVAVFSAARSDYDSDDDFEYSSTAERPASDLIAAAIDGEDDFSLTPKMDMEVVCATHYENTGEWDIVVVYD